MGNAETRMKQQLEESRNIVGRACDTADLQIRTLEREDTRLKFLIKQAAVSGDMEAAKIRIKDRCRVKKQRIRCMLYLSKLEKLKFDMDQMESTTEMAMAMQKMSKALKAAQGVGMNFGKLVHDFETQQEKLQVRREAMDDAMDTMGGDDEVEVVDISTQEEKDMLQQILDEAGVQLTVDLVSGAGGLRDTISQATVESLVNRLNELRS